MCYMWVGAAVSAAATIYSGYAQKKQAAAAAAADNYNAQMIENQAQQALDVATQKENIHRQQVADTISRQRAGYAAGNIALDTGISDTPTNVQRDTALLGEVDAMRIRSTGQKQYESLMGQAGLTRMGAGSKLAAGQNALTGSLLSAGGGLVSRKWAY